MLLQKVFNIIAKSDMETYLKRKLHHTRSKV